ncbi:helix-turn-helix transcriptional regulator [Nocardia uniformis]|uniref:Helix-turn-helix transcriptional regulator n=1 Tax=Nocardia uniformis TaxID=53432 RepID=A0A849C939_9NOCA|nr:helix-turn-helix domain-containing protein [Nocardia uniformis]NNH74248.1 helix-turn-helix transcriptional regulator [Nocardia uniformis]
MTGRARPGFSERQRRAERRIAILAAAREIIETQGADALSVAEICRRAGVTEPFFYKDFADLDAVVNTVADEAATEIRRKNRPGSTSNRRRAE